MKTLAEARLYAFVDTGYLGNRRPADLAAALCAGGADIIQLRAKNASKADVAAMAREILPVTRAAGVPLVVNDHLDVALEVGAEVCHLGQEDFFDAGYTHVSQLPSGGPRIQIGLSSHAPEQAERAVQAGASYVAIGPVFATPTKPGRPPVTLDYVRWAAAHLEAPWFAIGGITLENLDEVLAAGARRVCVVSAILNAPDVSSSHSAERGCARSVSRSKPGASGNAQDTPSSHPFSKLAAAGLRHSRAPGQNEDRCPEVAGACQAFHQRLASAPW